MNRTLCRHFDADKEDERRQLTAEYRVSLGRHIRRNLFPHQNYVNFEYYKDMMLFIFSYKMKEQF